MSGQDGVSEHASLMAGIMALWHSLLGERQGEGVEEEEGAEGASDEVGELKVGVPVC